MLPFVVEPEANMVVGVDFVRALGSVIRRVDDANAMVEKSETVRPLCSGLDAAMRPVRQMSVKNAGDVERVLDFAGCIGRCSVVA